METHLPTDELLSVRTILEDTKRIQIDTRIATLEREILGLKHDRNTISLIARLPPELLSRIFVALARMAPEPGVHGDYGLLSYMSTEGIPRMRTVTWSVTTDVCRHWREVALACPQLWSQITFHKSGWANLMLDRSKRAPLYLSLPAHLPTKCQAPAASALAQTSRLKSLKVVGASHWMKERILDLRSPTPILEDLELKSTSGLSIEPLPVLPADFLGNEAPKLRTLSLDGWKLHSWDSLILAGLTTLHLSSGIAALPSGSDFLDSLERMACLQDLHLWNALPESYLVAESRTVPLNHLKKLKLTSPIVTVATFLAHISISPSANLDLTCTTRENDDALASISLANGLHSWLNNPTFHPSTSASQLEQPNHLSKAFKSLNLFNNALSSTSASFYFEEINFAADLRGRRECPLHLEIFGSSTICPAEAFKRLPLSSICSLSPPTGSIPMDIGSFAQHLTNVQSVCLRQSNAVDFINYLALDPAFASEPHEMPPLNLCFPSLKHIVLSQTTFDTFETGYEDNVDFDEFLGMLMMRYEFGCEIHRVEITDAINLDYEDIEKIREVCVDVKWDGHVEMDSDPEDEEDPYHFMNYDDYYDEDEDDYYSPMFGSSLFY